jgi:hypothetical protein
MPIDRLTPEIACDSLARVGLPLAPAQVRVERRDERWVAHLPGQRIAWFAASDTGLGRLKKERRVLRLLEERCAFEAPRVLIEDAAGVFDVRTMVPGTCDPWRAYAEVRGNAAVAARVGAQVGAILAEQHGRIREADVVDWLPRRPSWPESRAWVRERLASVVDDQELIAGADTIMRAYEDVPVSEGDRALVHADVGLHNMAIDAESYAVQGLFDYDDAAWADRHHDFRYLVLDLERDDLLDAALSVYEPAVGHTIDRDRVFLYNAACAITFLAYRVGTSPEDRSCGRTLEQDLHWSKAAIARALSGKAVGSHEDRSA